MLQPSICMWPLMMACATMCFDIYRYSRCSSPQYVCDHWWWHVLLCALTSTDTVDAPAVNMYVTIDDGMCYYVLWHLQTQQMLQPSKCMWPLVMACAIMCSDIYRHSRCSSPQYVCDHWWWHVLLCALTSTDTVDAPALNMYVTIDDGMCYYVLWHLQTQ